MVLAIGVVSILNVKLLQLFIMEMRTLEWGSVMYMVNLGVYSNLVLQLKR